MVNRLVSIGEDGSLAPAAKVTDQNLPDRLKAAGLAASFAPNGSAGLELWDRASDHPNGPITTANTGQTYALHGTPVGQAGVLPSIVNGRLGQSYTGGAGAGYLQRVHTSPVIRLGGSWVFTSGSTTNGGAACLITWAADFAQTTPTVPNSPCHLFFTKTGWTYGVFSNGTLTDIAGGAFSAPLAADNATVHTAEVVIDKPNATAYITLPDGSTVTVTDSRIRTLAGNVAVWETIRNATTDPAVFFTEWWSDTRHTAALVAAKARTKATGGASTSGPVAKTYRPSSPDFIVVPTTEADVKAGVLEVTVTPGASGKVLMSLSAYLIVTSTAQIIWSIGYGTGDLYSQTVINQAYTGQLSTQVVIEGLQPNVPYLLRWRHLSTVANAATFAASNPSGYYASMTAQPL